MFVSRTFSTLRLLYRFQRYTSRDLKIYLVRSLIILILLYTVVGDLSLLIYIPCRSINYKVCIYFYSVFGLGFFHQCMLYKLGLRLFCMEEKQPPNKINLKHGFASLEA
jgi:hypothetical protein